MDLARRRSPHHPLVVPSARAQVLAAVRRRYHRALTSALTSALTTIVRFRHAGPGRS